MPKIDGHIVPSEEEPIEVFILKYRKWFTKTSGHLMFWKSHTKKYAPMYFDEVGNLVYARMQGKKIRHNDRHPRAKKKVTIREIDNDFMCFYTGHFGRSWSGYWLYIKWMEERDD